MLKLETERLLIRAFTEEDAVFILRLLNEPSFIQHIADKGVRTLDQARAYLREGPLQSYAANGHGLCGVALRETGALIGMCGLIKRDQFPDVDLGYAFLPEFWRQGYALEAAKAVLQAGEQALALKKTIALVSPDNAASIRLLIKLGYRFSKNILIGLDDPGTAVYERDLFPNDLPASLI